MGRINTPMKTFVVAIIALWLNSCSPIIDNHGYVPTDGELESLETGVSTKTQVAQAIGLPATANKRYGDDWYYVASRIRQRGVLPPEEIERQVVAVSFDEDGILTNVSKYGLEDGRGVVLSRRITETNLGRLSIIQQLLGSLGRVDPTTIIAPEEAQ